MTDRIPATGEAMPPRRAFLSQLAALPLIGGGLTLIGQPTAVAAPATPDVIEAYRTWLALERRYLAWEMSGDPVFIKLYRNARAKDRRELSSIIDRYSHYYGDSASYHSRDDRVRPSTRAALVLSTVGCDWRERHYLEA